MVRAALDALGIGLAVACAAWATVVDAPLLRQAGARWRENRAAWRRQLANLRGRRREAGRPSQRLAELAGFLELLAIAVDTGMGLPEALGAASESAAGRVSAAFAEARSVFLSGTPLAQALLEAARALELPEAAAAVRAMRASLAMGTPLADTLREHASLCRRRRAQLIEARIRALPLQLTIASMLFLFPPLFVVLILPNLLSFLGSGW